MKLKLDKFTAEDALILGCIASEVEGKSRVLLCLYGVGKFEIEKRIPSRTQIGMYYETSCKYYLLRDEQGIEKSDDLSYLIMRTGMQYQQARTKCNVGMLVQRYLLDGAY